MRVARTTTPFASGSTRPACGRPVDGEFELLPGLLARTGAGPHTWQQVVVIETGGRPVALVAT